MCVVTLVVRGGAPARGVTARMMAFVFWMYAMMSASISVEYSTCALTRPGRSMRVNVGTSQWRMVRRISVDETGDSCHHAGYQADRASRLGCVRCLGNILLHADNAILDFGFGKLGEGVRFIHIVESEQRSLWCDAGFEAKVEGVGAGHIGDSGQLGGGVPQPDSSGEARVEGVEAPLRWDRTARRERMGIECTFWRRKVVCRGQ
jgi:hypothetical protein